jgi:uncharacterized protein DUF6134
MHLSGCLIALYQSLGMSNSHLTQSNRMLALHCAMALLIWVAPASAESEGAPAGPQDLSFRILDGTSPAGHARVSIERIGTSTIVRTTTQLSIHRLLLKLSFNQRVEEHWTDGRFESMTADSQTESTLGNSHKAVRVSRAMNGTLVVSSANDTHAVPADFEPFTLWGKPVIHNGNFINVDGASLSIVIKPAIAGTEAKFVDGKACAPERVLIDGPNKAEQVVWISPDGTLCGLRQHSALGDVSYDREVLPDAP